MIAGLHRILHSGHQDERLIGPALPWYAKPIEKTGRYTTQWRRVDFDTTPSFGTKASCTIPVAGELVSRVYLVSELPSFGVGLDAIKARAAAAGETFIGPTIGYTNSLGHALLRNVSITVGNTEFDVLDSRLMETLDEFSTPVEKLPLVNDMIKRRDNGFVPGCYGGSGAAPVTVAVPLPFWCFNGDNKMFLPLDALNASRVQIIADFRPLSELIVSDADITTTTGQIIRQAEIATETQTQFYVDATCDRPGFFVDSTKWNFYTVTDVETYTVINGVDFGDLRLGTTYMMVEYVYVDKLETYSFRNGTIQYPIVQHRTIPLVKSLGASTLSIDIPFNNPVRRIYFSVQRTDAADRNMHFHAARDLYKVGAAGLWWPDASGLVADRPGFLEPGYSTVDSEPLQSIQLAYEGKYVRVQTSNPSLYRSLIPSLELEKSPWVNRYYYTIGFGEEANWDKIAKKTLTLEFTKIVDSGVVPNYNVYVHIETLNVLNVYGGTGSLLFDY
jgi:hypothetical protein